MTDPKQISGFSKTFRNIFIVSMFIFLISLLPFSYRTGYFNGKQVDAVELSTPDEVRANSFNTFVTVGSAIFAGVSALLNSIIGWLKSNLEYKTLKMQYEMQKQEMEKLHLELERKNKGKQSGKRK